VDNAQAKVPTQPTPATAPAPRFRGFDGVRGVAILLVLMYHGVLAVHYPIANLGPIRRVLLAGWTGVDLFFALSGFLITSLLLREEERASAGGGRGSFSIGRFYLRRALRILPAFYAVLALNVFVFARVRLIPSANLDAIAKSPTGLLPFTTFWANYAIAYWDRLGASTTAMPAGAYWVFWSLCVEEHFYLLWPLFLLLVKSARARVAVAVAVCVLVAVGRHVAMTVGEQGAIAVHYPSHFRIDSILWGGTAAVVSRHVRLSDRWRRILIGLGLASILALIFTDSMAVIPMGKPIGFSLGLSLLSLTAALLLLELVACPKSALARLLEFPVLTRMGKVSYGMYLVHLPMMDLGKVLFFATPRQPTLANLMLALAMFTVVAYGAAWILFQIVERPFLAIKDRHLRAG
jgi:peptidoglycan/LPS O-acetylase OafA/YrhL